MTDLLFKELSYKLTGLVYEIDNLVGYGQSEKVYADSFEELLKQQKIKYQRELYYPIKIGEKVIKKAFFDFLVDGKIVVEFKISDINYKQACSQIFKYLKSSGKRLGIIFRMTKNGVRVKRIPNYY